eukprot:scaffold4298_cov183-Amphora_coffeaeformis.AAC.8
MTTTKTTKCSRSIDAAKPWPTQEARRRTESCTRIIAKKPWPVYALRVRRKNKLNDFSPNPLLKNGKNKRKATRHSVRKWKH